MSIQIRVLCRQGNALVLSMLILLSMSAVGLVSVHRTNTDLLVAGNVSRMSQAASAADAGLFETLALVGWRPEGYAELLEAKTGRAAAPFFAVSLPANSLLAPTCEELDTDSNNQLDSGSARKKLHLTCRSSRQPDPTGAGKHRYLNHLDLAGVRGLESQAAAYEVEGIYITESNSNLNATTTEGDVCSQIWDYSSRGGVPSREVDVMTTLCPRDDPTCRPDGVVLETRSRATSGPVRCRLQ